MRILHYTLGLPPMRSGGLTNYALSLMLTQCGEDEVYLLYPGRLLLMSNQRKILKKKSLKKIQVFELCNPTLVPLLYGVARPEDILEDKHQFTELEMESFYRTVLPDILHIHTLMGLPKEIVSFMKSKGVSIVYTTHDYYGLCPKVNLINKEGTLCNISKCENCSICNEGVPSSLFLRFRNSETLLKIKNNSLLRKIFLR